MADVVLDTNVMGDFLAQYFAPDQGNRGFGSFCEGNFLSSVAALRINQISGAYARHGDLRGGVVVAPPIAFIELCRKWEDITLGRFSVDQLAAFIDEPAAWVNIATWDETLLPSFVAVPSRARGDNVEWIDAVFVATALARASSDRPVDVATTDGVLRSLRVSHISFV